MAVTLGQILIDLKAQTADFQKGMTKASSHLNRNLAKMRQDAQSFRTFMVGTFAAVGVGRMFTGLVEANRDIERMKGSLVTVTGSYDAAADSMDRLMTFAKKTPFTLDQSIEAFIKLKALGLDPSERAMESYGNTAAAMGKDLSQMIEAVADASTGEMERLKEFGIKAKQQGDIAAFTFRGVTTEVKRDAKAITEYLINIGETDFAGAMKMQMEGLPGKLSNLEDSFFKLKIAIGEGGFSDSVKDAADELANFITEFIDSGKAENVGKMLGDAFRTAAEGGKLLLDTLNALSSVGGLLDKFIIDPALNLNSAVTMASQDMQKKYGENYFITTERSEEMRQLVEKYQKEIDIIYKAENKPAPVTIHPPAVVGTGEPAPGKDDQQAEADAELKKMLEKLAKDKADRDKYFEKLGDRMTLEFDPMEKYSRQLADLNELRDRGLISAEVETRALTEANKELRESTRALMMETREWTDGAIVAMSDYAEAATDAAGNMYDAFSGAFDSMENELVDFFQTGEFGWKEMIDSMQSDLIRLAVKQEITGPLAAGVGLGMSGQSMLFDYGQGSESSGLLGGLGSLIGGLFGGFRADGGEVTPGKSYVVGERGWEIFTPDSPGSIISHNDVVNYSAVTNNASGESAAGRSPEVSIGELHVHGAQDARSARRTARQVGDEVFNAAMGAR